MKNKALKTSRLVTIDMSQCTLYFTKCGSNYSNPTMWFKNGKVCPAPMDEAGNDIEMDTKEFIIKELEKEIFQEGLSNIKASYRTLSRDTDTGMLMFDNGSFVFDLSSKKELQRMKELMLESLNNGGLSEVKIN